MIKKTNYETPLAELLVVRFEEAILGPSNPNAERANSASSGYDDDYDLGTI